MSYRRKLSPVLYAYAFLCLFLVSCSNNKTFHTITVASAATSSAVLKHAVQARSAAATAAKAAGKHSAPFLTRRAASTLSSAATATASSSAVSRASTMMALPRVSFSPSIARSHGRTLVSKSAIASSGYRNFSQRASRLQSQLQKSFSLRAILSDVITNHPGSDKASIKAGAKHAEEVVYTATTTRRTMPSNLPKMVRPRSFTRDLGRIATGTLADSWSGFTGGYALRTASGITRKLWSLGSGGAATAAAATSNHHLLRVHPSASILGLGLDSWTPRTQQLLQSHARSLQFGIEWAQMSAVFGASRLLVQSFRQTEDEWNSVGGSALAGAVFAALSTKRLPPVAMARGALLYGGTMFLLHPHLWKQGMDTLMLTSPSTTEAFQDNLWDGMQ